jgi:hypothetical protein
VLYVGDKEVKEEDNSNNKRRMSEKERQRVQDCVDSLKQAAQTIRDARAAEANARNAHGNNKGNKTQINVHVCFCLVAETKQAPELQASLQNKAANANANSVEMTSLSNNSGQNNNNNAAAQDQMLRAAMNRSSDAMPAELRKRTFAMALDGQSLVSQKIREFSISISLFPFC